MNDNVRILNPADHAFKNVYSSTVRRVFCLFFLFNFCFVFTALFSFGSREVARMKGGYEGTER